MSDDLTSGGRGAHLSLTSGKVIALFVIMLCSAMASGMTTPILPLYLTSLDLEPASIGLILALWAVGLLVTEYGWGWVSDRVGLGLPVAVSRLGMAAATFAFLFSSAVPFIALLQVLNGCFNSAGVPISRSYLGREVAPQRRGAAMGIFQMTMALGSAVGAITGGVLAVHVGYRAVFGYAAIGPLIGGVLTLIVFGSERPATAGQAGAPKGTWAASWAGVAIGAVAVLSAIGLLLHVGISGERSFLPLLANQRAHMSSDEIGLLVATLSTVQGLLMVPMGGLSDRFGRRTMMLIGLVLGTLGLILYPAVSAGWQLYPVAALRAVALAATWPALLALVSDATPLHSQGRVHGVFGTVEDVGLITGPGAGGYIWAAFGLAATFYFQAFLVGLGVLVVIACWRVLGVENRMTVRRGTVEPAGAR